jgi:ubiquinone/menaquinone biosynthesis C-methylase UbiE
VAYRTAEAKAQFDRWSGNYDRSPLQRLLFGPSHQMLLHHLRPTDDRLLDIGCGTGQFLSQVLTARTELEAVGLDLSGPMLDLCTTRCRPWQDRTAVVRGDSQRLPFADDTFDVITCSHSFHHYPDQARVVAEMHRVLRHGGRLLLIDGYRDGPLGWFMFDVVVTCMEGAVHHCSARRLRELFRGAGFGNIKQQVHRLPIPFMLTLGQARKQPVAMKSVGAAA